MLVEADSHDAIRVQEGFFHAVAMMHVNVNVQHPLVIFEQLQNGQNNVVDITEARRLCQAHQYSADNLNWCNFSRSESSLQ